MMEASGWQRKKNVGRSQGPGFKARKWKLEIHTAEQRIHHNVLWDSAESEKEEAGQDCILASGVFCVCVFVSAHKS